MRRVLFFVVVAGMLAVHPVIAQDAKRQVRSVQAAQQAKKALVAVPDATQIATKFDPAVIVEFYSR